MPSRVESTAATPSAGFTLIELLVVLTILSLLAALVPHFSEAIPGMRFRRTVSDLASAMRQARGRALSTGQANRLTFDTAKLLWVDPTNESHGLSPIISHMRLSIQGTGQVSQGAVLFMPDGSATPATLTLQDARRSAVISVNWITGDVDVEE